MKKSHWGDKGNPGPERESKVVKVEDLMAHQVMTVTRHQTVGHVRELLTKHAIHALPVVDKDWEPVGIVTSSDVIDGVADETLAGKVMTKNVHTVARYASPHIAARLMRKHKIHHIVVTHEQKIVGILSSFDLLRLIEDKRFVSKNLPSTPKKAKWEKMKERDAS